MKKVAKKKPVLDGYWEAMLYKYGNLHKQKKKRSLRELRRRMKLAGIWDVVVNPLKVQD